MSQNPTSMALTDREAAIMEDSTLREHSLANYRLRQVASKTVVSFSLHDPESPFNWPKRRKYLVLLAAILGVLNSTLGSSLPSGATSYIAEEFQVYNEGLLVLPISLFLVGYIFGPFLCGPLSESYGRKPVIITAFVCFMLFTLGCALSQSFEALLVLRLLVGIVGSAPISIVGGLLADVNDDPRQRGRAMAYFMAATTVGPILGPVISGFVSVVSWRWTFWIGLIFAGVTFPVILIMPETFEPIILQKRAKKLRKETGNNNIVAPIELEKRDMKQVVTVILARPIRMVTREPIVLLTCLYLAVVYAIFYLYFQTYPVIFQDIHGMSTGISGLMFFPIGLGAFIACGMSMWWEYYLYNAKAKGKAWANREEFRRLPMACVAGPLYVVSLFWLGWTARPEIHWVVPMLSGIPFGAGFLLIFIAMINYISDAYETYSASAQSASSGTRSLFAAGLPVAASHMFDSLGVDWACSLLAFISLALSIVPFAFIKYGPRIQASSKFCQHLKMLKEERRREEEQAMGQLESPASACSNPSDEEKGQLGRIRSPGELPQQI